MATVQLPQAGSSVSSPVPLQLDFRVEKIIGFLQPEHLANEGVSGQFANAVLFQSLLLEEIKDPIDLLLHSHPFCSRPKWNVDTPWSCLQMARSFALPSLHHTFSAFSSAPSFLPHPPLWSLVAMLLMVCSLFEKSGFYKEKPLEVQHESCKLNSLVHWGWKCCSSSGKWLSHVLHFKFLKQNWNNWVPAVPILSAFFQQRRKAQNMVMGEVWPQRIWLMATSKFSCF